MADIKLIACDMDGTLLNSDKQLSEKNIEAVKRLKAAGVLFVIATGRHDSMIKPFLEELHIEMPVISCNGALVREPFHDKLYSVTPIERDTALKVAEICRTRGTDYHIYCHNMIYGESLTGKIKYYYDLNQSLSERDQVEFCIDKDYKNFILNTEEELLKVLILSDNPDELSSIEKEINSETGLTPFLSDNDLLDTMQNGITKAYALEQLINKLGISVEETAAIGDQFNDLDMIRFAGTGIAMANAVPAVKEAASFVTAASNDESGVAEAIEKLLGK